MMTFLELTQKLTHKTTLAMAAASMLATVACAPENPRLMAPPVKYAVSATEAKPTILNVQPKVDIMFVIDNSDSMVDEQETLSKNIDKFAQKIATNSGIDFHVGVTSVWDTKMFAGMKKEYGQGELRRLKDPKGQNLPDSFGRFVSSSADYDSYLAKAGISLTKEPGWLQVLRASLKIGVESYNPKHDIDHTGGPENEEIFSPVVHALSDANVATANQGFRRVDAHLVLIFITDSDAWQADKDGTRSDVAPGDLEKFLADSLGAGYMDQVTVLGALAKSTDKESDRDPAIRYARLGPTQPDNILSFIKSMGGKSMGLRGADYGIEMGKLGSFVRERALTRPHVDISNATPERGTVKVSLNGEELVLGEGWVYDDARANSLIITKDLSGVNGAIDIKVDFTQVDAKALNSGRVHGTSIR
ncbi:hypothetical protein BH10BDE1_BH10BDE1_34180 [soil metagenome]